MLLALSLLLIVTLVFALLAAVLVAAAVTAFRRRSWMGGFTGLLLGLLLLALAALAGVVSVATRGYQALTREVVAATMSTEKTGQQSFRAEVRLPDGRLYVFNLAGDEFYVDARVLKWRPIVNILGLHTAYELDRVGGRYTSLKDEQSKPRTIHSLSEDKPLDMFELARRYKFLAPLVDAEYGSATFVPAEDRAQYEVRVSTSGLLMRRIR